MEKLKNSFISKTSRFLNRNVKKKSSFQIIKQGLKTKDIKNQHLLKSKNKIKISLLNKNNYKSSQSIKNKLIDINLKEFLSKNLLMRSFSYKKIDKTENKGKNYSKLSINKKCKKNLFDCQTQKLMEDIKINMTYNNLSNTMHRKKNSINGIKLIKDKNLYNLFKDDISVINKIHNKKIDNLNYRNNVNLSNNIKNNNNIYSIISLLNSKNKIFKRNPIQNLKNISAVHKNEYNFSNLNVNNPNENNLTSLITSTNSYLKDNYLEKQSKTNSFNNFNINNNLIGVPNFLSSSKNNTNSSNNTSTNYSQSNRNSNLTKQNKNISINYNIYNNYNSKKLNSYKYSNLHMIQKYNSNLLNDIDNINSTSNYYINTSNSNIKKYIDKLKPTIKKVEDNLIKNNILDNKLNSQFLKRNKNERSSGQKEISIKEKINKNIFINNNIQQSKNINSKNQKTEYNSNNSSINKNSIIEGLNHLGGSNKINSNLNNNKAKNIKKDNKMLFLNDSSIFSPIIKIKSKGNRKYSFNIWDNIAKLNNLNIKKNIKSNTNINSFENIDRIFKNKLNNEKENNSFHKKLNNKFYLYFQNYLY